MKRIMTVSLEEGKDQFEGKFGCIQLRGPFKEADLLILVIFSFSSSLSAMRQNEQCQHSGVSHGCEDEQKEECLAHKVPLIRSLLKKRLKIANRLGSSILLRAASFTFRILIIMAN